MTISFQKYNKNRQKEAEKEQLIQEFESINPDDAVLAAIMRATGQNTICGRLFPSERTNNGSS